MRAGMELWGHPERAPSEADCPMGTDVGLTVGAAGEEVLETELGAHERYPDQHEAGPVWLWALTLSPICHSSRVSRSA